MRPKARIAGLGSYLPEKVLTNQDLEKMVETSDEWITSRTGMKERRIAAENEYTSDMGYKAAQKAIEKAKIAPESIDLILFATLTPDYLFPSTACLIQERLGAVHAAAVDLQAACTGFIFALSMAKAYVEAGMHQTILVVASEKLSSIVDYKDRNTCILFGDGAAACIITGSKKEGGYQIDHVTLGADGGEANLLYLPAGGSKNPSCLETVTKGMHFLQMDGKEVFKHAVRRMESAMKECLAKASLSEKDIGYLVPHQANIRIIEAIAKRFEVPKERVFLTIHKYGNTSASSVGIALEELTEQTMIKQGEHLLLFAFGAGLTWGAALLTYQK